MEGEFWMKMNENKGPIDVASMEDLILSIQPITSKGLPVTDEDAGDLLPNLKSIYARSVIPDDRLARVSALNEQFPKWIDRITDPTFRESVQILFGLFPGMRGKKLTARRERIAREFHSHVDTVRKETEKELIFAVAAVIYDDLLRYRNRVKRVITAEELTGDAPRLGPEHLTHQEELTSRIWQHVYGLRAELIGYARLVEEQGYETQAEDHRQAVLREEAYLKEVIQEYLTVYKDQLIAHGEVEYTAEAVERLSKWQM
jgi:hypothetical protein